MPQVVTNPTSSSEPSQPVEGAGGASSGSEKLLTTAVALLILTAIWRITATYPIFNQTFDEPAHIAAGMEWLDRGRYEYEPLHPPLARVAVALGPWFAGLRSTGDPDIWDEGNAILFTHGRYLHNLALARAGVIPFFVLASVIVWLWSRRLFGSTAGLVATLLFVTLPPILAHSSLATTDIPLTATFLAALFVFEVWLDAPSMAMSGLLGLSLAAAILTKFSALFFLGVSIPGIALLRCFLAKQRWPGHSLAQTARRLAIVAVVMLLTIWAVYRFSYAPITTEIDRVRVDEVVGQQGVVHDLAYRILARNTPAPELFHGLGELYKKNSDRPYAYLLGHVYQGGRWLFFPVALAVKTPVPFLILALAGIVLVWRRRPTPQEWRQISLVLVAVLVMAVGIASQINIGLRHILPIYAFLAMLGAGAASWLWHAERRRMLARAGVVLLLICQLWSSVSATPDYLAYFNQLAGSHPEEILVDSDLDWGQDLLRLAIKLRELRAERVSVVYLGPMPADKLGLPPYEFLPPREHVAGWVAIGESILHHFEEGYGWLNAYQPVARAGKSIRIYHIPE